MRDKFKIANQMALGNFTNMIAHFISVILKKEKPMEKEHMSLMMDHTTMVASLKIELRARENTVQKI